MQALPRGLTMRLATRDDVAPISLLREELGWNVFEWALHDAMRPPHARFLLVTDPNGAIVGMGSGIAYGPIGVVGNMVVRPDRQRQGIGSSLLDAVIEFLADDRGCI